MLTLYACQNAPTELTQEQKNAIVAEIKDRLNGYSDALGKKDVEWFREFWANDHGFAMALDGDLITDYEPWFEKDYAKALPGIKEILHFKFGDGNAAILSQNAVSYATTFEWGMITTANDTIQSKGSIVYVLERKNGTWKCIQAAGTHKFY